MFMRKLSFASILRNEAVLALAVAACAPAYAITNGLPTTSFANIGDLGGASGVLIAPNWVLTASHVAQGLVLNDSTFDSLLGSSTVDAVYRYSTQPYPANDIALVHLATGISAAMPILNDRFISDSQARGMTNLTIVSAQNQAPQGYGLTSGRGTQFKYFQEDGQSVTVNWLVTAGGASVQGGDSGGALFEGAVSDSGGSVLLGVASASLPEGSGLANAAFVQTAPYKTWINSIMASSGEQALWVSSVPEPTTLAMGLLGGVALLARTGKRRASAAAAA